MGCSSCLNPKFFKVFYFASVGLQKHLRSRIWSFTPFLSRKVSKDCCAPPLSFSPLNPLWSHHLVSGPHPVSSAKRAGLPPKLKPPKSNTPLPLNGCCVFPQYQKVSPPLWPCATTAVEYPKCFRARSCNPKCRQDSCYCLGKFYVAKKWAPWGFDELQNPSLGYLLMVLMISKLGQVRETEMKRLTPAQSMVTQNQTQSCSSFQIQAKNTQHGHDEKINRREETSQKMQHASTGRG